MTIVEDENGDVAKLTIGNLEDSPVDPITTEDSILAVKQPSWSKIGEADYHIRVDHPSDLVLLDPEDDLVPKAWRRNDKIDAAKDASQWKKEGDMLFLKKKFRKALQL